MKEIREGLIKVLDEVMPNTTLILTTPEHIQKFKQKLADLILARIGVDETELERIINEHCRQIINKDKVMLVYGKLAQSIKTNLPNLLKWEEK